MYRIPRTLSTEFKNVNKPMDLIEDISIPHGRNKKLFQGGAERGNDKDGREDREGEGEHAQVCGGGKD